MDPQCVLNRWEGGREAGRKGGGKEERQAGREGGRQGWRDGKTLEENISPVSQLLYS